MDFFQYFSNPGWAKVALALLAIAIITFVGSVFQKATVFKHSVIQGSHSREAREARSGFKNISYASIFMFFIALIAALTTTNENGFFVELEDMESVEDQQEREKDFLTPKGGYGALPIVRVDRNCFARGSHEYENYTLFAGSFDYEESAIRMVSTLDRYNIRGVEYFQKQCDTVNLVGGQYFVFLGRKCTSLKSIETYETKYETMFREEDFVDLKIVKFVD